jgi:hypothetical protein
MGKARGWIHISKVMDDLGIALGGEVDIGNRMVLVASMGSSLRIDEQYVAYEELTDLICHSLKVVCMMGSWPEHVRSVVEKYPIEWFHDRSNCEALYWSYKKAYIEAQGVLQRETGIKLR